MKIAAIITALVIWALIVAIAFTKSGGLLMSRVPKALAYVLFVAALLFVTVLLYDVSGGHR